MDTSVFRPDTVKELVVTGGARLFPSVFPVSSFHSGLIRYGTFWGSTAAGLQFSISSNAILQRRHFPPVFNVHWFKTLKVDGKQDARDSTFTWRPWTCIRNNNEWFRQTTLEPSVRPKLSTSVFRSSKCSQQNCKKFSKTRTQSFRSFQ